ncbi:MAG: WYL domain-containing protein, partial [Gemmatimonadetes bacterium]|nr:WYL domain-containing protein [Gemmatimonadota bacterium]
MSEVGTAGEQLERILYLLPMASRDGGIPLTEAAERLGVSVQTLQRDLEEVTSRAFYHPAGGADEMQILIEANRLKVYAHRKFDRPTKLSGREMLALAIGLRAAAAVAEPERSSEIRDLAHRIEMELAVSSTDGEEARLEIDEGDIRGAGLRTLLTEAARSHTRCRIRYLKPGDPKPGVRDVDPYSVVYGSGKWYVIGHCHLRAGVRAFRLDRLLEAQALDQTYALPPDFDPADYVSGGRVFRSDSEEDVVVRYSPRVAPWVREFGPVEETEGGAVSVRFTSADP